MSVLYKIVEWCWNGVEYEPIITYEDEDEELVSEAYEKINPTKDNALVELYREDEEEVTRLKYKEA